MYKRRCDSCLRHSRTDAARAGVTTEASALPASMTSPRMRPARPTLSSTLEPPRRRSGEQPARTIRQPWMAQCDQAKQSSMVMSLSLASMINCRLSIARAASTHRAAALRHRCGRWKRDRVCPDQKLRHQCREAVSIGAAEVRGHLNLFEARCKAVIGWHQLVSRQLNGLKEVVTANIFCFF